jgi:hypothetical protein
MFVAPVIALGPCRRQRTMCEAGPACPRSVETDSEGQANAASALTTTDQYCLVRPARHAHITQTPAAILMRDLVWKMKSLILLSLLLAGRGMCKGIAVPHSRAEHNLNTVRLLTSNPSLHNIVE